MSASSELAPPLEGLVDFQADDKSWHPGSVVAIGEKFIELRWRVGSEKAIWRCPVDAVDLIKLQQQNRLASPGEHTEQQAWLAPVIGDLMFLQESTEAAMKSLDALMQRHTKITPTKLALLATRSVLGHKVLCALFARHGDRIKGKQRGSPLVQRLAPTLFKAGCVESVWHFCCDLLASQPCIVPLAEFCVRTGASYSSSRYLNSDTHDCRHARVARIYTRLARAAFHLPR